MATRQCEGIGDRSAAVVCVRERKRKRDRERKRNRERKEKEEERAGMSPVEQKRFTHSSQKVHRGLRYSFHVVL